MKKNVFTCIFALLAFFSTMAVEVPSGDLVIMTEKVVITSGGHENPHKSPSVPLYVYQTGHQFDFGESCAGCSVTLLSGDVTVYSTSVDSNGQVMFPSSLSGTFELQLAVSDVTYWAEVEL